MIVAAMVLEGLSLRTAGREAHRERSRSWWAYIRGTKTPETAVVLLEDTAAEVGLAIALCGVTLSIVTGDARYDAIEERIRTRLPATGRVFIEADTGQRRSATARWEQT